MMFWSIATPLAFFVTRKGIFAMKILSIALPRLSL